MTRKDIVEGSDARMARGDHRWAQHLTPLQTHLVAALGEFVGTYLFLWFGYAGHIMAIESASDVTPTGQAQSQTDIFIALSYGFSLLVTVWAFFRISGGLFNPAVSLGMCLGGQLSFTRTLFLVPSQIIASMCAGGMVQAMFPLDVGQVNTTLALDVSIVQGLFMEMFFTAYLVFVVLMLAAEKSKDTFLAPIGIGLALFVAEIPGIYYTGGSLNPARSFGCAVAGRSFPGYHWIYWLGPALGALLAAAFYLFFKKCHYEEVVPNQDASRAARPDRMSLTDESAVYV